MTPKSESAKKARASDKPRGFARLSKEDVRKIASEGGKMAWKRGKAHRFTSEEARRAGRKGGLATFLIHGADHMSTIATKRQSEAE